MLYESFKDRFLNSGMLVAICIQIHQSQKINLEGCGDGIAISGISRGPSAPSLGQLGLSSSSGL